jgi:hypothetical protein
LLAGIFAGNIGKLNTPNTNFVRFDLLCSEGNRHSIVFLEIIERMSINLYNYFLKVGGVNSKPILKLDGWLEINRAL